MKKIFIYRQSLMNGTVTASTEVTAFTDRELAEKTRRAIRRSNSQRDLDGMRVWYSDIEEINVYESEDEIPFFQTDEGKSLLEELKKAPTVAPAGLGRILFVGTKDEADDYLRREKEGKLSISERRPAWETAECWNALGYKDVKRIFVINCDEDASVDERAILHDIVRMYSGILTSDEVIGMVNDKQLRMKYDEDLDALVESMRKAWVHYMPAMTFADHRPTVSIDWQDYINDREHGKIVVTFKTEFLH